MIIYVLTYGPCSDVAAVLPAQVWLSFLCRWPKQVHMPARHSPSLLHSLQPNIIQA